MVKSTEIDKGSTPVFVLVPGNERGGAATHLHTYAKTVQQAGLGKEIHFIVVGEGPLQENIQAVVEDATIIRGRVPELVSQIANLWGDYGNSLLHAHGPRMNLLAYLASRKTNLPWTSTLHSHIQFDYLNSRLKTILLPRVNKFCLKHAAGLFTVNQAYSQLFPRTPTWFVPNAIEPIPLSDDKAAYEAALRQRLGLSADIPLIGIAARLDPVKDIATIIRAVARLTDLNVHLAIAGHGTEEAALKRLAQQLSVQERVHFLGFVEPIYPFYAGLTGHVLASVSEGTPSSILEAGFYGVPNIGTNISGITQLIEHGKTGLCFRVGDDATLNNLVRTIVIEGAQRTKLVDAFRAQVLPRFTPQKMLEAYLNGYESMLRSPVGRLASSRTPSSLQ